MTKYAYHKDNSSFGKEDFLLFIANELAEANRLKRVELNREDEVWDNEEDQA